MKKRISISGLVKKMLLLLILMLNNLVVLAQFEREYAIEPCKGCYWKDRTYYKPKGQTAGWLPGRPIKLYSCMNGERIKNLFALASREGTEDIDWIVDLTTNQILIDVRSWKDGKILLASSKLKSTEGFGSKCANEYWLVIYDGGSVVLDTNFVELLPFVKGSPYEFRGQLIGDEPMKDLNDWAIKNPNSGELFDINGKPIGGFIADVQFDFGNDIFLGTDNKLYVKGKVVNMGFGVEANYFGRKMEDFIFYQNENILVVKSNAENGNLINLETLIDYGSFYFKEVEDINHKPILRNGKYFLIKPQSDALGVLNAKTGKYCNEQLGTIVYKDGAFYTKGTTGDYSLEVDPETCGTSYVGAKTETYSVYDINIFNSISFLSSMSLCLTQSGKLMSLEKGFDGDLHLKKFNYPTANTYSENSISSTDYMNKIIALQGGGYAACGRDHLVLMDDELNVHFQLDDPMLNYRAYSSNPDYAGAKMDTWKTGSGTGTAVDFLDIAENSNGTEISSVFLFHAWVNGAQKMYLGLSVQKLSNPSEVILHDLAIEVPEGFITSTNQASIRVNVIYLNDTHVLISFGGDGFQQTVVSTELLFQKKPLNAKLWQGNLFDVDDFVNGGLVKDGDNTYIVGSGHKNGTSFLAIGRIEWQNNVLTLEKVCYRTFGFSNANIGEAHCVTQLNENALIISGISSSDYSAFSGYPYFVEFDLNKFDLNTDRAFIVKNDDLYNAHVADLVPYSDGTGKAGFVALYGNHFDTKSKFTITQFTFSK
ncbi:MAG: hypothetical protein IPM74_16165 [Crocinitomicaceae bacterium]|nr:hypothetical protein [Crocinitomicaceae bacterium]MBK8927385.1 hypothetical protein [Crocinitomicaceae bacterium]